MPDLSSAIASPDPLVVAVAAHLQRGRILPTHPCSLCGYLCAYVWDAHMGPCYDPGCHCTQRSGLEARSFADLASHCIMNRAHIEAWLQEEKP